MKLRKEDYKLKPGDFIPVVGLVSYFKRIKRQVIGKSTIVGSKEYRDFIGIYANLIAAYHIFTSLIILFVLYILLRA